MPPRGTPVLRPTTSTTAYQPPPPSGCVARCHPWSAHAVGAMPDTLVLGANATGSGALGPEPLLEACSPGQLLGRFDIAAPQHSATTETSSAPPQVASTTGFAAAMPLKIRHTRPTIGQACVRERAPIVTASLRPITSRSPGAG